jgi:hypothetical protein
MTCPHSTIASSLTSWRWKTRIPHPRHLTAPTPTRAVMGSLVAGSKATHTLTLRGSNIPCRRPENSLPQTERVIHRRLVNNQPQRCQGSRSVISLSTARHRQAVAMLRHHIRMVWPTPPLQWSGSHLWSTKRRLGQWAMQHVSQTLWPGRLYHCSTVLMLCPSVINTKNT